MRTSRRTTDRGCKICNPPGIPPIIYDPEQRFGIYNWSYLFLLLPRLVRRPNACRHGRGARVSRARDSRGHAQHTSRPPSRASEWGEDARVGTRRDTRAKLARNRPPLKPAAGTHAAAGKSAAVGASKWWATECAVRGTWANPPANSSYHHSIYWATLQVAMARLDSPVLLGEDLAGE